MEPTTPKEAAGALAQNLAPIVTDISEHAIEALNSIPLHTGQAWSQDATDLHALCVSVRDAATELETAKNALFQLSSRGG